MCGRVWSLNRQVSEISIIVNMFSNKEKYKEKMTSKVEMMNHTFIIFFLFGKNDIRRLGREGWESEWKQLVSLIVASLEINILFSLAGDVEHWSNMKLITYI